MTKMMKCTCLAGHDFEIPARRGRPPVWCDTHRPNAVCIRPTNSSMSIQNIKDAQEMTSNKGVVVSKGNSGSGIGNLSPADSEPGESDFASEDILTPEILEGFHHASLRTLHCERGDHDYQAPIRRGKPPRNCPDHLPEKTERPTKSSASIERIVEKALEHPTAKSCHCDLSPQMSAEEIRSLNGGCTEPFYVCSTLDSIRRNM